MKFFNYPCLIISYISQIMISPGNIIILLNKSPPFEKIDILSQIGCIFLSIALSICSQSLSKFLMQCSLEYLFFFVYLNINWSVNSNMLLAASCEIQKQLSQGIEMHSGQLFFSPHINRASLIYLKVSANLVNVKLPGRNCQITVINTRILKLNQY
ncbi:hypothetical protein FGO68_gene11393 [Halteria grandinella]|uniref:Transmembrane protein n=1 Tax=Halteria grandinella TaxID=5974 RepID=A0A8J8P250_HALGN|nr:hypothetical protein FGO68_gene11393 [Halteria grandinella]